MLFNTYQMENDSFVMWCFIVSFFKQLDRLGKFPCVVVECSCHVQC